MQKKIGKVTVDYFSANNRDFYSDGSIEDEILQAVKNGKAEELLEKDNRWPVLYHLSSMRENIVSWIPIKKTETVLEVGSGLGAITGVLCEKAAAVETVEISPKRAEIAAYRNRDRENLTIHVGNLNDLDTKNKFDYVTLIGVLEYAGSFTHTENPYADFLTSCKKYLKPNGKIVIAIENRLGMKYFSGAHEDHTGRFFDGLINYEGIDTVRTFSHQELKKLLQAVDFQEQKWYYPYPDYKLPSDIFSEKRLPTAGEIRSIANYTYDSDRIELFSETKAFEGILEAELFGEFANSFLVIAQNTKNEKKEGKQEENEEIYPAYVHYAFLRKKAYATRTEIYLGERPYIRKVALNESAKIHIAKIVENCQILSRIYGKEHVAQAELLEDGSLQMEYIEGVSFSALMAKALQENGAQGFADYINFYCKNILRGTRLTNSVSFDVHAENRHIDMDINFDNIIVRDGNFVIIDYEWLVPNVPSLFVLHRILTIFYMYYRDLLEVCHISLDKILMAAGINESLNGMFCKWSKTFYEKVVEQDSFFKYVRKRKQIGNFF